VRTRPSMTRRDPPPGTEAESQRDIDRMKRTLQLRTNKAIASGPASQEAGEVWGVPLAGKTPTINGGNGEVGPLITDSASSSASRATGKSGVMPVKYLEVTGANPVSCAVSASLTDQQELLGRLTASPPLPVDPQGPAPPLEPVSAAPVVPDGYVAEPPTLEWLSPINHACGEKTQVSAGGQYEILGRRTPQGFLFIAKRGLDTLGSSKVSAEEARQICSKHHGDSCNG
jgi:hypothetical protein